MAAPDPLGLPAFHATRHVYDSGTGNRFKQRVDFKIVQQEHSELYAINATTSSFIQPNSQVAEIASRLLGSNPVAGAWEPLSSSIVKEIYIKEGKTITQILPDSYDKITVILENIQRRGKDYIALGDNLFIKV